MTLFSQILIIANMDWKKIISELVLSGWTQKTLGEHIGRSQGWVSGVQIGKIRGVRWEDGQALIQLHAASKCTRRNKPPARLRREVEQGESPQA